MTDPCATCEGCGKVADTPNREPWTAWLGLPAGSNAAVALGVVQPIPCEDCGGSGKRSGSEPRSMYERAYWEVQRVLSEALGTEARDGAGEGIAADVELLAQQRDGARERVAELTRERDDLQAEVIGFRTFVDRLREELAGLGEPEPEPLPEWERELLEREAAEEPWPGSAHTAGEAIDAPLTVKREAAETPATKCAYPGCGTPGTPFHAKVEPRVARVWQKGDPAPKNLDRSLRVTTREGTVLVCSELQRMNTPHDQWTWHVEGKTHVYAPWWEWVSDRGPLTEVLGEVIEGGDSDG